MGSQYRALVEIKNDDKKTEDKVYKVPCLDPYNEWTLIVPVNGSAETLRIIVSKGKDKCRLNELKNIDEIEKR